MMKTIRNILVCLGILVVGFFGAKFYLSYFGIKIVDNKTEIAHVTVESELQAIGQIATYQYNYKDFMNLSDSRTIGSFKIPGTKKFVMMTYCGIIKAGYDCKDIKAQVDEEAKRITVKLPDVKILDNYVDTDSVEFVSLQNNVLNPINGDEAFSNFYELKSIQLDEAKKNGLMELARDNMINILKGFLSEFSDYDIEFE